MDQDMSAVRRSQGPATDDEPAPSAKVHDGDHHGDRSMTRRSEIEELKSEIERLQAAKRRALAIANERVKEAVELRHENERLKALLAERDRS
jgi:hypothetical protein